MFPGEEKGIVTSPGHKFELHYHILFLKTSKETELHVFAAFKELNDGSF